MTLDDLARVIARTCSERLILITGPSCVGKSTFAQLLSGALGARGSCTILAADDYLRSGLHGNRDYLRETDHILTPNDYNWPHLWTTVRSLLEGTAVTNPAYRRGAGWTSKTRAPADHLILEGLFLDSTAAASQYPPHFQAIGLVAPAELLRRWRLERDEAIRGQIPGWRDPSASEAEFNRTQEAFHHYKRSCRDTWLWHELDAHRAICSTFHG